MADPPGLVRRGKGWIIRVRVPDRLRPFLNRLEITKSLKTTCHQEARLRAWHELKLVAHRFAFAEMALGFRKEQQSFPVSASGPSQSQIIEIAKRFVAEAEAEGYQVPILFDEQQDAKAACDEEAYHLSRADAVEDQIVQGTAAAFAAKHGLGFPDGRAFVDFCNTFRDAMVEVALRRSALLDGKPVDSINPAFLQVPANLSSPVPSVDGTQSQTLSLSDAIDAYIAAPERSNNSDSTRKMDRSRLGALRDILGPDRKIAAITRSDMRDYVGKLMKLPANAGQRFKGLSAPEAIVAGEVRGSEVLSSKSVKLYCDAARSFFAWLEREELIIQNPAKQLASPKVSALKMRRTFTADELVALLKATSVKARGGRDWAYWCTRINLLHGFRLTEPLGLLVEDLVMLEGVLVFRLRENEHRSLKSDVSTRDVPVHPRLIELGITDLLVGKNAGDRLLGDAPKGKGKAFNAAQKQISRLIDKHVTTDKKLTFHSLRHGFRDEARRRSVPRDVVERLGGWSASDRSAMDGYGEGYGLDDLLRWLSTMTFDGLLID